MSAPLLSGKISTQKMDTPEECHDWLMFATLPGGPVGAFRLDIVSGILFARVTDQHPKSPVQLIIGPYRSFVDLIRAARTFADPRWGDGLVVLCADPPRRARKQITVMPEGELWASLVSID